MIYKGVLIAAASGRIADSVWSHNRGGPYVRSIGNPNPNPATAQQTIARAAYASCIAAWQALTTVQRDTWYLMGAEFPEPNAIGTSRPLMGFPAYVRANMPRILADDLVGTGLSTVATAPTDPRDRSLKTTPTASLATDGTISLTFDDSEAWNTDGPFGALLVYASRVIPATRRLRRSPLTSLNGLFSHFPSGNPIGAIAGDPIAHPNHCTLRLVTVRPDGSRGLPLFIDCPTSP